MILTAAAFAPERYGPMAPLRRPRGPAGHLCNVGSIDMIVAFGQVRAISSAAVQGRKFRPALSVIGSPRRRLEASRRQLHSKASNDGISLGKLPGASSHKVQLTSNGFKWPESIDNANADTAFLEINIEHVSTDVPWPSIRADRTSTKDTTTHYFEPNASGRQYLDLSRLLPLNCGEEVGLISEDGTQWQVDQEVSLTTFTNPPIKDKRVLVLSPHPDDAEIAAYGLYTSSIADIVTITAGDAGKPKFANVWDDPGQQYRAKGRIRTVDSLVVPLLGGLRPDAIRNLGYYDGTLEDMHKNPFEIVNPKRTNLEDPGYFRRFNYFDEELRNRPLEATWKSLVADVHEELERIQPDIVVTPHPLLDSHKDHKFTTVALVEALKRWNRHCSIYLYNNHTTGNEAFPFGPRSGQMGLPPMDQHMIQPLHVHGLYSHPLSEEIQKQKLVALEAHHDLRAFDVLDGSEVIKPPSGLDYYRRARPNEFFMKTDFAGVWGMCQQIAGYL